MTSLDFDKTEFLNLAERTHELSLSLFIPTHQRGKEVLEGQDAIAFKNHLQAIRLELEARNLSAQEINGLMQPLEDLLADATFWRHRTEGLAVYRSPDYMATFDSPLPLANDYKLLSRFWVRPLLPYVQPASQYYLLQIGKKGVTLYQADPYAITPLDTNSFMPAGLEEVTRYYDFEEELQGRTKGQGGMAALYTSDDSNEDQKNKNHLLADYFRLVDEGINKQIGTRNVPLLLASVAYYQPIYQQVNTYPHLHKEGLTGNFDHVQPDEMHRTANGLLSDYFGQARQQRILQYQNNSGSVLTSQDLRHILESAATGRIEVLFITPHAQAWGHFDEETLTATIRHEAQEGDASLIDQAALRTLQYGGDVYVLDEETSLLEAREPIQIAALYRF